MRVNQIMTPNVVTIDKDVSLVDAIERMRRHEISRLVVVDAGRIEGIITERDIVRELGSMRSYRLSLGRIHVSNVMTTNPITVAPDVTAKRAAELMLEHDISGLPVVEKDKLVGIITKMDFAKVCMGFEDIYVGQVMQSNPRTISPCDRVIHARRLLLDEDLISLPVLEGDRLVGIVTVRDVATCFAAFQEEVPDKHKSERIRSLLVEDIMTKPVVAIRTDARLCDVARDMFERRFSSVPVLNLRDELVGLITKTELAEVARERL
ncbi:MAG: CBS domain-containing protein [Hadesarchaea archaeon]|nr:CBS domain-containing protein [Hadesarchaea archaeon]